MIEPAPNKHGYASTCSLCRKTFMLYISNDTSNWEIEYCNSCREKLR